MTRPSDVSRLIAAGSSVDEQLEPFELVVIKAKRIGLLSSGAGTLVVFELIPQHNLSLVLANTLTLLDIFFCEKTLTKSRLFKTMLSSGVINYEENISVYTFFIISTRFISTLRLKSSIF